MLAPRPHQRNVLPTQSTHVLEEGAACVCATPLCHGCVISVSPPPLRSITPVEARIHCWPSPQLGRPWHPRPAPPKFLGVLTPHHSSSKHLSGVAPEPRVTIVGLDPTRFVSPRTCPQSSALHFYLPASLLPICTMVYVKFSYSNQ
jgi:hypothetical protein